MARLVEGVLSDSECHKTKVFLRRLEYPQYTRPPEFRGKKVPAVLTGGNHAEIDKWRYEEALKRTLKKRPDLL